MKYDAFISYRHLERDLFVAKGVHRALETSNIPMKIQKETGRKRINRVFRDQEELPIGSDLGSNIEAALADSGFLIVICTPQTKESYWVMKEIDTFISMHGRENILAVLADGEPSESFPPQLCCDDQGNPVEPLAADVRGNTNSEIKKKINSETLRLVAAILGCDYDDLKQRHRERVIKRYMAIISGVAVLAVAFGVYNAYNLNRISENYEKMQIKESKVLAEKSLDALDMGDREAAGLLAMEGLPAEGKDRPLVSDCIYALERAVNSYDLGTMAVHDKILRLDLPVYTFQVNNDGSRVVSVDEDYGVYWWDLKTGKRIIKRDSEYINGQQDYVRAVGENDGRMIVVSNRFLRAFDEDEKVVYEVQFEHPSVSGCYIDDMNRYAVVERGGDLELYDLSDGSFVRDFKKEGDREFACSSLHFSGDYSYILAYQYEFDSYTPTLISLLDIKTGEQKSYEVKADSVEVCNFTADHNIVVVSSDSENELSSTPYPMYVQKFDMNTGKELFCKELEQQSFWDGGYMSNTVTVNSRIYEENNRKEKDLIVTQPMALYNLDLDTGELKLTYRPTSEIVGVDVTYDSDQMFVGTYDGRLSIVSGVDGTVTPGLGYQLADKLQRFFIGRGHIIARDLETPNLVVLSILQDSGKVDFGELEANVNYTAASPMGKTFLAAVYEGILDGTWHIHVYDTKTGQELKYITFDDISFDQAFYKDEDTIIIPRKNMAVYQYTISTGEVKDITFLDDDDYWDLEIGADHRYFLYSTNRDYYVVDIASNEIVRSFINEESDKQFLDCIISNYGRKIYGVAFDDTVLALDLETGEWTEPLFGYYVKNFTVSQDGVYLAACCTDGNLRIFNTASGKIAHVEPYYGDKYGGFMEFSADGNLLFLQGQDMLFRVYDLKDAKYTFISDVQMQDIDYVSYDKEKNQVAVSDGDNMYVVDLTDKGFLHYIPGGRCYISSCDEVICSSRNAVYMFKVLSMEELVENFRDQFGEAKLTYEQRLRYKLD